MLQPKKDEEFIKSLLNQKEGSTLDYKQRVNNPEKLAKTLVAFANSNGGILLIGVSDQGKILGIDAEEESYMVQRANNEYCYPTVKIEIEMYEMDKSEGEDVMEEYQLLLVKVAKSKEPCYHINNKGERKLFKRVNDQTLPDTKK